MATTLEAQVRLLIADQDSTLFQDEDLAGFLALNDDHVLLAAADALDAIATSEALLSKKITTQDRSTDGPAVAAALRKHAESLRARHYRQVEAEDEEPFFMFFEGPGGPRRSQEGEEAS